MSCFCETTVMPIVGSKWHVLLLSEEPSIYVEWSEVDYGLVNYLLFTYFGAVLIFMIIGLVLSVSTLHNKTKSWKQNISVSPAPVDLTSADESSTRSSSYIANNNSSLVEEVNSARTNENSENKVRRIPESLTNLNRETPSWCLLCRSRMIITLCIYQSNFSLKQKYVFRVFFNSLHWINLCL